MDIQETIKKIIKEIGDDPKREGLKDTPKRVAKAYEKLFGGYNQHPERFLTVFDSEGYDEMITVKDIDFYSTCEHHMLPFFGKAFIGYIPDKKIIGLSKIPRMVEVFARRLQNQERLTQQIANTLNDVLKPKGVGVVLESKHLCMMARGVEKADTNVTTSAFTGLFRKDHRTRNEFLQLLK
jgi:GTP cyclohydrolase I